MAQASKVGKKTNKKTQSGRDVYETPEGEMVSEKSTTFKYKGKWINVPTIHKGKQYDDSTLKLMLDAEIIEPTSIHNSLESAKKAAQERTDSLEFNEGGAVTDMDEEMNDMLLDEQVDPVSGNTAPVGALPSEVRDDIDIRVSENEYVIPAYAVRYFGEDFFDELLVSAKEGWERIKEGDELPFRDDELEVESDDDDDKEELKEGYAEGGNIPGTEVPKPVGGGYGRYGGKGAVYTGVEPRTFVNPDTGREVVIFFFNGRPINRIPEGFRPKGETVVEEQQQVQRERVQRERDDDDDDISLESIGISDKTWRNKPVSDWTDEDYTDYAKSKPMGAKEKLAIGAIGSALGGFGIGLGLTKFATELEKKQAEAVQQSLASRMKSGNVNQDQINIYSSAVKTASDRLYGGLGLPDTMDLLFASPEARTDYYEGLSAASDKGFKTGFDAFTDGFGIGKDRVDPVTGAVTKGTTWRDPDLTEAEQKTAMEKAKAAAQPSPLAPTELKTRPIARPTDAVTTPAPRDEKSTRLDATNPNTSANVAEHLSDREKESLRANPELAGHYVATANRRANEAAAGDTSNTDRAKEASDSGGFSFSDLFS